MSEQINIDELERLAKAATPGPWESEVVEDVHAIAWIGKIGVFPADGRPHRDWAEVENDSSFIAAANPATVLTLISQLRAVGDRAMHLERRLSDANGEVLRLQGADQHALRLQAGHDEAVMRAQALEQERDALAARLEVCPEGGPDGIERHDACTNLRNRAKFTSAPICRAMGWHETAAQARERGVLNSLDDNRATLLQIREGYQADQVARRALMMGRK